MDQAAQCNINNKGDNGIVLSFMHRKNNPRNSEGSFVALADERILFAYTHYYDGDNWDDTAPAHICARYSSDGGHTWTDDEVLVKNDGGCNVMSVSLLRLQDGRIGLWYLKKNSLSDCNLWMRTSDDEGGSWSQPRLCIPAPGYFVVNNDRVIQLSGGRLVIPAAYHRSKLPLAECKQNPYLAVDGRGIAIFFISDDGGVTWRESRDWWAMPVRSDSGLQEPGVVELKNGQLYAYCRTSNGCQYELYSSDGGDTWTPPSPSGFISPCSPLSIKRMPSTGHLLAVWNDWSGKLAPASLRMDVPTWGRTPLVAAISEDEGATWAHGKLIETDPERGFCYTTIHFVEDAVLLAYCCGGGKDVCVLQDMCIRRIELQWLYGD